MVNIASRSRGATTGLVCDLHHIARSVLHQIGEERSIAVHDQEASTSHGPSITSPVSSTPIRKLPIRGKGRVDRRGHGRDGWRGHGRDGWRGHGQDGEGGRGKDGEGGRGTLEPTLPTSILPHTYPSPDTSILPQTFTHHSMLLYPHRLTHHLPYPHTLTHFYHFRCRQSHLSW